MTMLAHVRETFAHTPRTLSLVWRSSRGGTLAMAGLTVALAVLPLGIAWVGKRIVDAVVAHSIEATTRWVLVELALVVGQSLAQRGHALVRQLLGARLSIDIHMRILSKARVLELRHFEDPEFYDKLTRARREASSRPLMVVNESFGLVQNGLTLAGYAALLVGFSGWAVLGLLLAAFPAALAEVRYSNAAFKLYNWRAPESRRLNYLEYVLANDEHAKEVKLFGLGPMLLHRYRTLSEQFFREDRALAVRRAGWAWLLSLVGTGTFYACYVIMALAAARRDLTLGEMTLYIVAFRHGQQAFQAILAAIGGMYEHNLYMSNLFSYLAIQTPEPAVPGAPAIHVAGAGVRFDEVGFRYPGRDGWALRGLGLDIPAGRSLALVGRNGAGKTTLVKLLARLYEPTEGRIFLDGRDLASWDPELVRRRISVVFQDFNQYQLSVRDNIGVGSVDHLEDDLRIRRAADRGGAEAVVAALHQGLETPLGRWFHKGVELSGGQWQKVALSRAFMREEADILILDEPTAALDAEAEHAVFERFRTLSQGRTTILISHRFPTVRMADRIVVLEEGRIVEEGTHVELVARGERYAHLFKLQAQGYVI